jgi:glycosyltransferase involved in cell wall biosynthesis
MSSVLVPKEIIVVNDGGTPELVDLIKDIKHKTCPIIYSRITEDIMWNQQGARNLGIWLSTGDYIANEDTDHFPHSNFYKEATDILKNEDTDIVATRNRFVISIEDALNKTEKEYTVLKTRGYAPIIATFKRKVATYTKGYNEQFCGNYGWEVPEWIFRVELCGFKRKSIGAYYTPVDTFSRVNDREWDGKNWKMSAINYHHWKRIYKNRSVQSPIGLLNFNYTVEII